MRPSSATAFDGDSDVGARIRDRREALGITQMQLADLVGVRRETVYAWETGRSGGTWQNVRALCKALDCDENTLLGLPSTQSPVTTIEEIRIGAELDAVLEKVRLEQIALRAKVQDLAEQVALLRMELTVRDAEALKRTADRDRAPRASRPKRQP